MSEARMATPEDFNRELMRLPVEGGICGAFTRDTLFDGIRVMGTPKDIPDTFSDLWDQSVNKLIREQQLVVLPSEFKITADPKVLDAVRDSLLPCVGQLVTEAMVKRVVDDVTARVSKACGYTHPDPKTVFEVGNEPPKDV